MNGETEYSYCGETLEVAVSGGESVQATVAYSDRVGEDRMVFVFPPDPMLGGDSRNNVVQALLEESVARGVLAVTFDYRGSRGEPVGGTDMMSYWEGLHERGDFSSVLADARAVEARARREFAVPGPMLLAGYSFGCLMALEFAVAGGLSPVACISPPLNEYDFRPLVQRVAPAIFLATEDAFCPPGAAAELVQELGLPVATVASDDHFFRGCERALARQVCRSMGLVEE